MKIENKILGVKVEKNNKLFIVYYNETTKQIDWNEKENFNQNLEYLDEKDKDEVFYKLKQYLKYEEHSDNYIKINPLDNIYLN